VFCGCGDAPFDLVEAVLEANKENAASTVNMLVGQIPAGRDREVLGISQSSLGVAARAN
jgi:hypothetical protein